MIAILDYRAGNLTSVKRALDYLGHPSRITSDPREVIEASRVIFPGVGAAGKAMENLKELGLDEALREVFSSGRPMMGICLGVQIIFSRSEEDETPCLGLLEGEVKRFPEGMREGEEVLKVPHMGWNWVKWVREHPLIKGIDPEAEYYFVHSYYPDPAEKDWVIGWTDYGICFASAIGYRNLVAVQFHPEKSGRPGLKMLDNFCRWRPDAQ